MGTSNIDISDASPAPNSDASGVIKENASADSENTAKNATAIGLNGFLTCFFARIKSTADICISETDAKTALETSAFVKIDTAIALAERIVAEATAHKIGLLSPASIPFAENEGNSLRQSLCVSSAITTAAQKSSRSPPKRSWGALKNCIPNTIEAIPAIIARAACVHIKYVRTL